MQTESQALGALLNGQARRLKLLLGHGEVAAQPGQHSFGRLRGGGAVVALQKLAGQRGLPHQAAVAHAHGDGGVTKSVQRIAGLTFFTRALQMHGDARQHFLRFDRLGDVVNAANFERSHQVFSLGQPGHEDDGYVRCRWRSLEAARHFKAVHTGHHGVEQDDVGQSLRGALQCGLSPGGHQHGVAGLVQSVMQHSQVVGHVIDDQHHVAVGAVQGLF